MVYSELNKKAWDFISQSYQKDCGGLRKITCLDFGPLLDSSNGFGLVGRIRGKTVLDIGCGAGENAIFFAKKGASKVFALDISEEQINFGKKLAELNNVKIDFLQGNAQTLPLIKSKSIDLAFSVYAFQYIPNLNLCFKEVSRVLKKNGSFVFSLDHPVWLSGQWKKEKFVWKNYWAKSIPQNWSRRFDTNKKGVLFQHTIEEIFSALIDNGFNVKQILEPKPIQTKTWGKSNYSKNKLLKVPSAIILKANKEPCHKFC